MKTDYCCWPGLLDTVFTIHAATPTEMQQEKGDLDQIHLDVDAQNGVLLEDPGEEVKGSRDTQEDVTPVSPGIGMEDHPPWYLTLLLGFQHYVTMLGGMISLPVILAPALCIQNDEVAKTHLLNTMLFTSGLATLLQAGLGTRLPIIQGAGFAIIAPVYAILSLDKWTCPEYTDLRPDAFVNLTNSSSPYLGPEHTEMWNSRMREIQGAIMTSSILQVVLGCSGLMGSLLYYIGPLSIAPTLSLIGLAFFKDVVTFCSGHWGITMLSLTLVVVFSQYLRRDIPMCTYSRRSGCHLTKYPLFEMFPVILTVLIAWSFCAVLTACGVFPEDPVEPAYAARADAKLRAITDSQWFRLPYPCQWGLPTVSAYGAFGMLAATVAGIVESIGDYYACAKLVNAPTPPVHAINRGVFMEGIGCIFCGLWGSGAGTTSYTENISVIAVTKVGSRRVIYAAAGFMMVLSTFGKFGAIFMCIPDPIIGGISIVLFGLISAIGMSNLQYVDMASTRNLFIVGISFFFGILFPFWLQNNKGAINTGVEQLDQVISVLLSTSMFVGGFLGFFFDNTLPGTEEERGIKVWRENLLQKGEAAKCYNIPFVTSWLHHRRWSRYVPISPTYSGINVMGYIMRYRKGRGKAQETHD